MKSKYTIGEVVYVVTDTTGWIIRTKVRAVMQSPQGGGTCYDYDGRIRPHGCEFALESDVFGSHGAAVAASTRRQQQR